ncbi:MAG TPA: class I SAM-dependent methyltransferase [Polyangiaceae bacterium]|nr:class I SAM-dependent methyltransferase [Polyangiaceae bacterium]
MSPSEPARVPCYVCGATAHAPWGTENGHYAVRCKDCGLVYVSPRPTLASISRAAQTGLHGGEQNLEVTGSYGGAKRHAHYLSRLADLFGAGYFHGSGERWLDVGAGFGELLETLAIASGGTLRTRGLEPNEAKAASARARHLDVSFTELSALGERFHYLSLLNVFSHLPDPPATLMELATVLEPGGELVLQTGNFAELERNEIPVPLELPDHLSFANERLLRRVLDKSGFTLVSIRSYPMYAAPRKRGVLRRKSATAPERQPMDLWLRARRTRG